MHITFVTSGLPFHGNSLKEDSLGGSETAVVSMAAALRKLGHRVRVFCNCSKPGNYDGVLYFPRESFEVQAEYVPTDVLIASRWTDALMCPSAAGLRVLWLHDTVNKEPAFLGSLFQTDMIFGLSKFHIENHCAEYPMLRPLFWKTQNGVDRGLITGNRCQKVPGKLIYSSRPERGLLNLLRMMPRIWAVHPKATLHVCTYDNPNVSPEIKQLHETCDRLIAEYGPRVVKLGSLRKAALYQQISSSDLMLYPTAFPEISCISAIEAQACGTPIITTDGFALPETVLAQGGALIPGRPEGPLAPEYDEVFIGTVNQLLSDRESLTAMSEAASAACLDKNRNTWEWIANTWVSKFSEFFASRSNAAVMQSVFFEEDYQRWSLLSGPDAPSVPPSPAHIDLRKLPELFRAAKIRFKKLIQLLQSANRLSSKITPKILDFAADDISFGLYAAKALPEAEIVIAPKRECFARIQEYVESAKLTNVTLESCESAKFHVGFSTDPMDSGSMFREFDLVHIGTVLEETDHPHSTVEYVTNLVKPSGLLCGMTRWNEPGFGGRSWNLDYEDLRTIFDKGDLTAAFHPEGRTKDGRLRGYWLWCTPPCAPKKIDVQAKLLRTREYQTLAVCMIVKNEADWLSGCLRSVASIADEIVVVDTGSTDNTIEIAQSFGAKVKVVPFDNFAQARNASIEGVTSNWILWIDADERIIAPESIRKYLQTRLFNGFSIRQNHLVLDVESFYDTPVRLLRNCPNYRFTGLIHEHCEDVSEQPYDKQIEPTFNIPDVDIAHFGYIHERTRRQKCSRRNFELLIRDVQESPGRMLTWTLVMRDYLNMVKWHAERTRSPIQEGSFEHDLLNAVVATYHNFFVDGTSRYYGLAEKMYQEALMRLGMHGLCALHFDVPPFQVSLGLAGAVGGLRNTDVSPRTKWFVCVEEFQVAMASKAEDLAAAIQGRKPEETEPFRIICELPDAVSRLRHGVNAFPEFVV